MHNAGYRPPSGVVREGRIKRDAEAEDQLWPLFGVDGTGRAAGGGGGGKGSEGCNDHRGPCDTGDGHQNDGPERFLLLFQAEPPVVLAVKGDEFTLSLGFLGEKVNRLSLHLHATRRVLKC